MTDYQAIWESIPIRHDTISYLMGSGVFIGLLLVCTIILRWRSCASPTRILAVLILCICLTIFDIFLGYTGLMKHTLFINNFSESLVILSIPLVFLLLRSIVSKKPFVFKTDVKHLVVPFLYLAFQIPSFYRSAGSKLNDYTQAYHTHLPFLETEAVSHSFHKPVIYSVAIFYCFVLARLLWQKHTLKEFQQFIRNDTSKIRFVRNAVIIAILIIALTTIIYTQYNHDLGDHIIGIALTYIITSICFFLMNESRIFTPAWIADKYETSGFKSSDPELLTKANAYILEHEFHLQAGRWKFEVRSWKIGFEVLVLYATSSKLRPPCSVLHTPVWEHALLSPIGAELSSEKRSFFV